ncbi:hypothetical protein [Denitromonas halophila]|uniref:Uncharacterized protein n=1 Tax=Denitromonas halophila TaxID=1629404 RepID=A0A557QLU5_9RHOO|nr:hypothetical protein [Denitromonas halophila]TVO53859.1 hypothetical protein FHP91_13765 [Denitromonas halophila]
MSDAGKSFELGGIVVPFRAALGYEQQIEPIGASSLRRTINGSAIKQTAWAGKLRVTLSGDGWSPLGLDDLDYALPMTLKCHMPIARRSQSPAITLPTTRRSDAGYAPFARASLAGGAEVETAVSLVGDVATCTAVGGAISYAVWYWPQLVGFAEPPTTTGSAGPGEFGWQIVFEES